MKTMWTLLKTGKSKTKRLDGVLSIQSLLVISGIPAHRFREKPVGSAENSIYVFHGFIEKNDGYILDLNVMGEQYVFFLPYGYPLVQPQIWVYKGRDSYEITFAKHCWKKEYTISEIISSIERGYNEQTY